MEIKNKNIFLNLNGDEEVLYVAEQNKWEFYLWGLPLFIIVLPLLSFFVIMSVISGFQLVSIWWEIFGTFLLLFILYTAYTNIRDCFFTDIILTNQRLLIIRFNKLISIDYSQIKYISGNSLRGPSITRISLQSKKFYLISFVDPYKFKKKLKEIYSGYNDEKILERDKKQGIIAIIVLTILFPVFLFLELKFLPKDTNNQQIIEKHKKHSNDPKLAYFDSYMNNLQNKIKSNWNPPKSKISKDVILKFKIARDGSLVKTKIIKSSDDTATDMAAIEALKRSAPFEPLPKQFKDNSVDVEFTFDYNVLNR